MSSLHDLNWRQLLLDLWLRRTLGRVEVFVGVVNTWLLGRRRLFDFKVIRTAGRKLVVYCEGLRNLLHGLGFFILDSGLAMAMVVMMTFGSARFVMFF